MRVVEVIFDRSDVVLVCKLEHILVAISVVEYELLVKVVVLGLGRDCP